MTSFVIFLIFERPTRHWFRTVLLISTISLSSAWVSHAQASVALKSIALPQAMTRKVVIDKSQWQGVSVELERLHSPASLEATLEQLATLLPELTPIWSDQGMMQAHWTTAVASYALILWQTQTHATEGLLSGLARAEPLGIGQNSLPAQFAPMDWLPKQTQQLFRLIDNPGIQPIVLTGFIVSTTTSQLVDHLIAYGRRNGWVRLPNELTFLRNERRLSFQVMTDIGQATVLMYETSRDAP